MAMAPLCSSPAYTGFPASRLAKSSCPTANSTSEGFYCRAPYVGAVLSTHRRSLIVRAQTSAGQAGTADEPERDALVAEFMQFVNATQQSWPHESRRPTALMPPNTVVKVQMDSLMRNDWPEEDSGVRTAFQFSMPAKVGEMLAGQVPESVSTARAWDAAERYLTFSEFSVALRDSMYAPVINCADWKAVSPVVFHGPGDSKALQCVKVTYQTSQGTEASCAYTFCLQKVQQGAYRNCWMVVGVRLGDYANV
eukprot:c13886_g1_i1 orf=235-990(-)